MGVLDLFLHRKCIQLKTLAAGVYKSTEPLETSVLSNNDLWLRTLVGIAITDQMEEPTCGSSGSVSASLCIGIHLSMDPHFLFYSVAQSDSHDVTEVFFYAHNLLYESQQNKKAYYV